MAVHPLALALLLTQAETPATGPLAGPVPLPVPRAAAAPAPAPAGPLDLPPEVLALLPPGRTPVEARQADLDLDGAPEWIVVSTYLHPTRLDNGPRSAEWRAGQRIESRATHELAIVGRERGALAARFTAELSGNERQAIFVEPLLGTDRRRGRYPVLLTGARACAGACGPVEVHLVTWDPRRKAFADYAYLGAELVVVAADGAVELWFADRQAGDPLCCPSGYTVTRVGMYGFEVDTLTTRSVPADRMRKLLLPGRLIFRGDPPPITAAPPGAAAPHP